MEEQPRSRTVLAVGKKTLEDRQVFEQKRIEIESKMEETRNETEKLRKRPVAGHLKSPN